MKNFTTEEIRDLFNRVMIGEISFPEMVEVLNYRMSEEPRFKNGDFVYEDGRIMIFKSYPNNYHCMYYPHIGGPFFDSSYGIDFTAKSFRRATEEEKQVLLDALAKAGKRWNEEKKCVEDIPIRKFKKGDKVRIKEGVSSETHGCVYPYFTDFLSQYMGKVMTVEEYITTDIGEYVTTYEAKRENHPFGFSEDWLEPYEGLKDGDFVSGLGCIFILHKRIDGNSAQFYVLYAKTNGKLLYHKTYFNLGGIDKLELATESEKQELIDVLAKEGKMWNAEKRCIEDIPKHKFKVGDMVRIKDGVSSKTHAYIRPFFANTMDKLIGKVLTVEYCDNSEVVICDGYAFLKEWLEPYAEGLKKGDLVILWNNGVKHHASVRVFDRFFMRFYCDIGGVLWQNAIKFESKEQYERFIKGEI